MSTMQICMRMRNATMLKADSDPAKHLCKLIRETIPRLPCPLKILDGLCEQLLAQKDDAQLKAVLLK